VGQPAKRVGLVHELAQLAAPEEVLHHGGEGLAVDEARGREHAVGAGVEGAHALADQALRAAEADTALVLQQLAGGADAAVAEVVDVVDDIAARLDVQQHADRFDHVDAALVQHAQVAGHLVLELQLEIDLVAPDAPEVVAARVEEEPLDELLGVGGRGGIAGTQAVVDVVERLLLGARGVGGQGLEQQALVPRDVDDVDRGEPGLRHLLEERLREGLVAAREDGLRVDVDDIVLEAQPLELLGGEGVGGLDAGEGVELAQDLLVGAEAQGAQEGGGVEFAAAAAAIEVDPHDVARVKLDLDPGAAVGDQADGIERLAVGVQGGLGADAGGAVELRDDHALGAVDDEGAVGRHQGDLAHEDLLLAHLLALLEGEGRVEGGRVRPAAGQRLDGAELRLAQGVLGEVKHVLPRLEALDGEDLAEDRLQSLGVVAPGGRDIGLEEILVRLRLDLDQVGRLDNRLELAEYVSLFHRLPRERVMRVDAISSGSGHPRVGWVAARKGGRGRAVT